VKTDNKITAWALRPAAWWQFWRPQSGWRGGLILNVVGLLLTTAFIWRTCVVAALVGLVILIALLVRRRPRAKDDYVPSHTLSKSPFKK
jgi:hypothetical protein